MFVFSATTQINISQGAIGDCAVYFLNSFLKMEGPHNGLDKRLFLHLPMGFCASVFFFCLVHSVVCVLCLCCARQGPAGNVYYLDLDVLETKCHTGSPKPWKRCDIRPFMETVGHTCTCLCVVCARLTVNWKEISLFIYFPLLWMTFWFSYCLHRVCSSSGGYFFINHHSELKPLYLYKS